MSDPVRLFQIQTEALQARQHRASNIVHPHQQIKIIHLCNTRDDLDRFKYSFITPADITGKRPIRFLATVDDGAGLCAIDTHIWAQWQRDLGTAAESEVGAKVGSGHIIRSRGYIVLHVNVEGVGCDMIFEILDSQGAFEILLGKPWLRITRATRDYNNDTLTFRVRPIKIIIPNRASKLPQEFKTQQEVHFQPARNPSAQTPDFSQRTHNLGTTYPRLAPLPLTPQVTTHKIPRTPRAFPGPIPAPNRPRYRTESLEPTPAGPQTQPQSRSSHP
ncbi:hypothetical protein M422DRAFT_256496 [Sphaerobolus stellatus SS14]|uniref:Uncharacterized protein n=1 Tax=Sphaerobolus stellatus (strain SS14) TaxID=990650 RepID=A0A0C9VGH5_SPHS4|nr:hypothetical protein M422DRAFT_256496 [Sphaerobolus stellatus SS14]